MNKKHTLLKGTVILTATGLVSRIVGFFYRIFLSRLIGAEGMGIYQLIFPVFTMCFSFTTAGIETAISKFVAEKISLKEEKSARDILYTGLLLAVSLSLAAGYLLLNHSAFIAVNILDEPRCSSLLAIMAFAVPLCSIHSCITGYYYGTKETGVPAIMQLMEQGVRVASVYIIYSICTEQGTPITAAIAVYGLVFGELCSMLVSVTAITLRFNQAKIGKTRKSHMLLHFKNITFMSLPLTLNKVLINFLQSAEAVLIPSMLRQYGLNTSESLSIYGILTGMALPLILFPSAITNSVSVMLLPTVAEAQATNQPGRIRDIIQDTIKYCMLLGILCTGGFLIFGNEIGILLFGTAAAGKFILTLSWICPFLYLTTTLNSIIHGLGRSVMVFINNAVGLGIRILFVVFMIPRYGINGYLWGLLASQLLITILCMFVLNKDIKFTFPLNNWVVKPVIALLIAYGLTIVSKTLLDTIRFQSAIIQLLVSGILFCAAYCFILLVTGAIHIKRR